MKLGDKHYSVGDRGYNDYTSIMGALVILKLITEVVLECPKTDGRTKGKPIDVSNGGTELDGKFYQIDPQFVMAHDTLKSFDCKLDENAIRVTHEDMSHTVCVEFTECAYWEITYSNWKDQPQSPLTCGGGDLTNILSEVDPQ